MRDGEYRDTVAFWPVHNCKRKIANMHPPRSCDGRRPSERERQCTRCRLFHRGDEACSLTHLRLIVVGDFSEELPRGSTYEASTFHLLVRRASANTSSAKCVSSSPRSNAATRSAISALHADSISVSVVPRSDSSNSSARRARSSAESLRARFSTSVKESLIETPLAYDAILRSQNRSVSLCRLRNLRHEYPFATGHKWSIFPVMRLRPGVTRSGTALIGERTTPAPAAALGCARAE